MILLVCGIASAAVYVATDVVAGLSYPGYSFRSQAVSELFAIGAPTARPVVALFSVSSVLLAAFAAGVHMSAGESRALRFMAVMFALNAVDSLVLWNFFPMHMRGVKPALTDTMHGVLAINPFVVFGIAAGVAAFRNWFRVYSLVAIAILAVTATLGFLEAPAVFANQPTPWLGVLERTAQYSDQLWQAILAVVLLRK